MLNPRLLVFLAYILLSGCTIKDKGQIIIIGTIHFPSENIDSDKLYNILDKVKPDVILFESDSSNFNSDFTFKNMYNENEFNAVSQYKTNYPNIYIRPYDIEGRNQYRIEMGIQNPGSVFSLISELEKQNALSSDSKRYWDDFVMLSGQLDSCSNLDLQAINALSTDEIVGERQMYQYKKVREIVDNKVEFTKRFIKLNTNDSISLRTLYNRYTDFERQRENQMVQNILNMTQHFPNKKIVVLTGFYHRYYLVKGIQELKSNVPFELKEFYN